jgi:hypothetical protein
MNQAQNGSQPRQNVRSSKNALMKYTLVALAILTAVSALSWGLTSILLAVISVLVAVTIDCALSLVMKARGPLNTLSAAVFGLIVALSYSLANTSSFAFGYYLTSYYTPELLPLIAPMAFVYVALIAAIGMILFKKLQGLLGEKIRKPRRSCETLDFSPLYPERSPSPSAPEFDSAEWPNRLQLQQHLIVWSFRGPRSRMLWQNSI